MSILEEEKNNNDVNNKKKKKHKNGSEYDEALVNYINEYKNEINVLYNDIQNFETKNFFFFVEKPYEKISLSEKHNTVDNPGITKESNDFIKENKKKKGFSFDFQILNSKDVNYEKMSID